MTLNRKLFGQFFLLAHVNPLTILLKIINRSLNKEDNCPARVPYVSVAYQKYQGGGGWGRGRLYSSPVGNHHRFMKCITMLSPFLGYYLPVAEGGEELVETMAEVSASWSTTGIDGEWLSARLRVVASGDDTGLAVELLVVLLADVGLDLTGTVVPDIFVLILNGSVVLLCSAACGDRECLW